MSYQNLPKHIRENVEAADNLLAQNALESQPSEPPPHEPPEVATQKPPETTPVLPAEVAAPVAPPQPTEAQWEHKYRTLKGLFDKEVPSLQQQVKALTHQVQQTNLQLEHLRTQPKPPPAQEYNPEDKAQFGPEMMDMVNRIVQQKIGSQQSAPESPDMQQRLSQVEGTVQSAQQMAEAAAQHAFFERFTKLVPEWESINANPVFLQWLGDADPVYGTPRQDALDAAQRAMDVNRTALIFRAFAPAAPAPAAPVASLDKQISPRAVATSTASAPANLPILTNEQITEFYRHVAHGRYRGREKEQAELEAEINSAMLQGRIR